MVFRVRWWIKTYQDFYTNRNRVVRAMIGALKKADIILLYAASSENLTFDSEDKDKERAEGVKEGAGIRLTGMGYKMLSNCLEFSSSKLVRS